MALTQPATIVTGWFSTVESLGAFPATFLPQFLILSIREYHNHLMLIIALIYTHKCQQNQKLRMNMREKRSEKKQTLGPNMFVPPPPKKKKMTENKEQGSRGERRPGILFVSIVWHRM